MHVFVESGNLLWEKLVCESNVLTWTWKFLHSVLPFKLTAVIESLIAILEGIIYIDFMQGTPVKQCMHACTCIVFGCVL